MPEQQGSIETTAKADISPAQVSELIQAISGGQATDPKKWHWISVVGVGTFLLVPIVFWMMWMISGVVKDNTSAIQDNSTAMTAAKEQGEDVESALRSNRRALDKLTAMIGPDEDAEP